MSRPFECVTRYTPSLIFADIQIDQAYSLFLNNNICCFHPSIPYFTIATRNDFTDLNTVSEVVTRQVRHVQPKLFNVLYIYSLVAYGLHLIYIIKNVYFQKPLAEHVTQNTPIKMRSTASDIFTNILQELYALSENDLFTMHNAFSEL